MSEYTPDAWVILKITTESETLYKVLAGWHGGYLNSDYWKLNSGITNIIDKDKYYEIHGYSGSVYLCYKSMERLTSLTGSVLSSFQKQISESTKNTTIEIEKIKNVILSFESK